MKNSMENKEIKKQREELYAEINKAYGQIKEANEKLNELRNICTHEKIYEGEYSPRSGQYFSADICEYCEKAVKIKGIMPYL